TAVDSAITSRLNRDSSIPVRPWVTPSHIAGTPPANWATPPASRTAALIQSGYSASGWCADSRSLYAETMPTAGTTASRTAARSGPEQAAKPWARWPQPRPARAVPSDTAAASRARYAPRLAALRSAMRAVTSASTGFTRAVSTTEFTPAVSPSRHEERWNLATSL